MGCSCCRMIKSYIYDPSVSEDVPGQKRDSSTNSLYQRKPLEVDGEQKAQGYQNFGYSSKSSEGLKRGAEKLEIDNNEINRLHAALPPQEQGGDVQVGTGGWSPYIIEPEDSSQRCTVPKCAGPGNSLLLDREGLSSCSPGKHPTWQEDRQSPHGNPHEQGDVWEGLPGVRGTPDGGFGYTGLTETGYASTASLSTTDTRVSHLDGEDDRPSPGVATEGRSSEEVALEVQEEGDDAGSVTDSDVAEALAALDAATAGEDFE